MTAREDGLAAMRALFPGAARSIYMNAGVKGLLPLPVRRALDAYLDARLLGGPPKKMLLDQVERTRHRLAAFIAADPDEVAFTKNATEGLSIIASALPWRAGENIVACPEIEHPANIYPWLNLRRRHGVEVKAIPARDGHLPVDAMLDALDDRTRLVAVPTVSFAPGFVSDLSALTRACHARGIVVVADAAQSVGVLHTDVRELDVDALAFATQKGLLAMYGQGALFCRAGLAERLEPAHLSRFGVDLGDASEAERPGAAPVVPARGARRFDLGNYNYPGIVALEAALELLESVGTPAIDRHVRRLAGRLAEGLIALGLPVCGGPPGPHLGHIVTVGALGEGQHDSTQDARLQDLYDFLTTGGVMLSIRRGVLRFALHLYNSDEDVERVIELTRAWTRGMK